MRIIFVRHAQPNYQLDCLTPIGHRQAQAAAERLKEEPIKTIYASTSGRAIETAEYIARQKGLPIHDKLEFMRELSWGGSGELPIAHKGQPWITADHMVRSGQSVADPQWQEKEPFCENTKLLAKVQPVSTAFDRLLLEYGLEREGNYYRLHRCDDSTIAMVSHAGSSSMVLSHLFNLPFPFFCAAISPDFSAITVVEFSGEEGELISPRFELVNDARHIADIDTERFFGN